MSRENQGVTIGDMIALSRAITPEDTAGDPSLAYQHQRLLAFVEEFEKLNLERNALEARKQAATTRLNEILVEGSRQTTLLEAMLKVKHGPASEKLAAYGIKIFRGRKRRRGAEEAVEPTAKATAPDAPAAGQS